MPSILRKDAARWRREIRETFLLATPLILGQLSSIGMNVIDTLLAGHWMRARWPRCRGHEPVVARDRGSDRRDAALPPSVAQLAGAGEHARIGPLFRQALWLAFALGIALFFMVRASGVLLDAIGIEPAIAAETRKFLHAIAWGAPALTGYFALRGFSEGLSIPRPTMYFGLLGLVLLLPIGYVLMCSFGLPARSALWDGKAGCAVGHHFGVSPRRTAPSVSTVRPVRCSALAHDFLAPAARRADGHRRAHGGRPVRRGGIADRFARCSGGGRTPGRDQRRVCRVHGAARRRHGDDDTGRQRDRPRRCGSRALGRLCRHRRECAHADPVVAVWRCFRWPSPGSTPTMPQSPRWRRS
jgi:hypothetical protein